MPATVYLVKGEARFGTSRHGEIMCEQLSQTPIYMATTGSMHHHANDEDFRQRMAKHQQNRQNPDNGCSWTTIEEPLHPSKHIAKFSAKVVLLDCLTVWLTNWMMNEGAFSMDTTSASKSHDPEMQKQVSEAVDRAMKKLEEEFLAMTEPYDITYVIVTNDVEKHPETPMARKIADAQGWCNEFVAARAQQVYFMNCGFPHLPKNDLDDNIATGNPTMAHRRPEAQRLDRYLSARSIALDAKGYFLVKTDPRKGLIVVSFHSCLKNDQGQICDLQGNPLPCHHGGQSPEPMQVWRCRTAKEVTTEIFERWAPVHKLELTLGHAAYIGREAQKAEFALFHGDPAKFQQD